MNDLSLKRIIDIQKLVLQFREIKRITYVPGAGYENDVEHSYSLAMMAWLMGPRVAPHLDPQKLMTYAMVHDLVEVYAGDTFCFGSKDDLASKDAREARAFQQISKEYVDFPALIKAIQNYESREDEESRFIYALDKLQGIIINYLDGGRVWHEHNITLDQMINNKLGKTATHPTVHRYTLEIAEVLKKEPGLFPDYELTKLSQALSTA